MLLILYDNKLIVQALFKAVVFMTATPDYINFKNIDLLIKISLVEPITKPGTVVKYSTDSKGVMINVISNQHVPGKY